MVFLEHGVGLARTVRGCAVLAASRSFLYTGCASYGQQRIILNDGGNGDRILELHVTNVLAQHDERLGAGICEE